MQAWHCTFRKSPSANDDNYSEDDVDDAGDSDRQQKDLGKSPVAKGTFATPSPASSAPSPVSSGPRTRDSYVSGDEDDDRGVGWIPVIVLNRAAVRTIEQFCHQRNLAQRDAVRVSLGLENKVPRILRAGRCRKRTRVRVE